MEQTFQDARFPEFFDWIHSRGVTLHPSISVQQLNGAQEGNGIVATNAIPKNTTLFTLPRPQFSKQSPILTVETSQLLALLSTHDRQKISKNWLSLVLVLIWERVHAILSPSVSNSWAPYFNILPVEFDTLMFWNSDDLRELTGSTILNKIGKEEAEEDYQGIIKPLIESRGDLFPVPEGTTWEENYGLSVYHRMGSLILSRSFHVEPSNPKNHGDDDQDISMDTAPSLGEPMNDSNSVEHIQEEIDDDDIALDDDDDEHDHGREPIEHIAMLPLADLLNAKSGSENDYESHKSKEKLPKTKLNNEDVITLGQRLIDLRLKEYSTSIDEDKRLLKELKSNDKKNTSDHRRIKAIIVRKSEKEILISVKNNLDERLLNKKTK